MHQQIARLAETVMAQRTIVDSVLALLSGLAERLRTALDSEDMDAITELTDALEGQSSTLAAAVSKNTPAEAPPAAPDPNPVPVPVPVPAPVEQVE